MKTPFFVIVFYFITTMIFGQQTVDTTFVDTKYREDQFYFSVTYDLLGKKPKGLKQSGFSNGIHFGVIRDMPINERRNKAFGVGLGLSVNTYNQNLLIDKNENGDFDYEIIDESVVAIKRNKFSSYLIEVPLQYRWRTSTAKDFKFWRVYTGLKVGYVFYNSSKFRGSIPDVKLTNIDEFNKIHYGLTLSAGYSTWNFHVYYGLNSVFEKSAEIDEKTIDMNSIKIGLMFYVL